LKDAQKAYKESMYMKRKIKIILAVTVMTVIAVVAFSNELNVMFDSTEPQKALAFDTGGTMLTAELKEALAKAGPTELIRVWLEFDVSEYERKTGSSIFPLIRQYRDSGMEKILRNAKSELLPEEVMATVYCYSKGVEPPIEILKQEPYLVWYVVELTPSETNSIVGFPGLQKLDLREPSEGSSKVDPIIKPLIAKTAKEYPAYRLVLIIDLYEQINPETAESWCNFEHVDQIVQEHGGQVSEHWKSLHSVAALVPPNLQAIAALSSLDDVESISPNWVSYVLD
jgi:hypothetical protein